MNFTDKKYILIGVILILLSGCLVSPTYKTPSINFIPTSTLPDETPTVVQTDPVIEISFADVEPKGFREDFCWNAIGVDKIGHVYMAIGYGDVGQANDVGIFRYTIATGEHKFLTTLKSVSAAENNLLQGENIIKGHSRIVEMGGKIYLVSQGFHDMFAIDPTVRGGHFFQKDVATEQWHDLSVTDPGGVSILNQGIIAVDVIPSQNKVVGFSNPAGNIVIYDLSSRHSKVYTNPDASQYIGRNVSRHVVYSSYDNSVYAAFAGSPIMRLDLTSGVYATLPASSGEFYYGRGPDTGIDNNEFITAMAKTGDGKNIWYLSWDARLYHFDVVAQKLTRLGPVNTSEELSAGIRSTAGFALAISKDEKYLYSIPSTISDGSTGLYRFDIIAGTWNKQLDLTNRLGGATFSGGDTDADGHIYFARFGGETSSWVHLLQIDVIRLQSDP
jgi:hypothetical protein